MLFTTGRARSPIKGIIISIAIVVTRVEHKTFFLTFFFRREHAVKRGWEIVVSPVFSPNFLTLMFLYLREFA